MRGRISTRLLSLVVVGAFVTPLAATSDSSAASTHGLKVVTQFQPPAPGQIDVIAVVFSAGFTGKSAPPHPITMVTLPGATRPHNYGLLFGSHLTKVSGHVATYLWLTMALKPLGATASHDQPLVGELRNIPEFYNHRILHVEAEALTINNGDVQQEEQQHVAISTWLREDGTLAFSVYDAHHVWTYNDFNWDLNPIPPSAPAVWNNVVGLIQNPQENVAATVQRIGAILHASFLGETTPTGSSSSTPGSPTAGSGPTSGSGSTSGAGSFRLTCPTGVTQGQSIQITVTVGSAAVPVAVDWTLPNGSTVQHTAIPSSTDPTSEHDSIGTSQAGLWHVVATEQGHTATCPAVTVTGG